MMGRRVGKNDIRKQEKSDPDFSPYLSFWPSPEFNTIYPPKRETFGFPGWQYYSSHNQ